MILIIDNYDSFTYNLYQYLGQLTELVRVARNDKITTDEITAMAPLGIVISPGPGRPENAAVSVSLVERLAGRLPILGVCLGHQVIGQVFGGTIGRAPQIMHGKISSISHDGKGVFRGLPLPFTATRYHSLVIEPEGFPEDRLEITARAPDGTVMGVRHREFSNLEGVQFHPESILTEHGLLMMKNFVESCGCLKPDTATSCA